MGKPRDQIQKEYRERKKAKEGKAYLEKESARVKAYYVPAVLLSRRQLKKRREQTRKRVERHRIKRAIENTTRDSPAASPSTSEVRTPQEPLTVRLKFNGPHKRKNNAGISQSLKKKVRDLEAKNTELTRSNWRLSKQMQRLKKQVNIGAKHLTPNAKSDAELREAGLTSRRFPSIKKKLLFTNVISEEIKNATKEHKKSTKIVRNIVVGQVVRKYRMMSKLTYETGLSRHSINVAKGKSCNLPKRKVTDLCTKTRNDITSFLERDDNSRMMPGKEDTKTVNKDKKQKRILNDYMKNLHLKYNSESTHKVSLSTFCRCRPKHIIFMSFTSRSTCLCQKHQNMALKLKALKSKGIIHSTNPDDFIKRYIDDTAVEDLLERIEGETITFEQWKRVTIEDTKKMKIVSEEMDVSKFKEIITAEITTFREHAVRVKVQYFQIQKLKTELPQGHMIIQMDFAENYQCKNLYEIQSAYWTQSIVTIHPVVVYFKDDGGNLVHKSYVIVSDELGHNAGTVHAFLCKLIPLWKTTFPSINFLHYWTDSPTSQYRKKLIFKFVSDHQENFGVGAAWSYFEAGHGKGPCDGVGGTVKRMADDAVKGQRTVIQDAKDFYRWAKGSKSVSLEYIYVSKEECLQSQVLMDSQRNNISTVQGTMKIHAMFGIPGGIIFTRDTSCYCEDCFGYNQGFNQDSTCGWKKHIIFNDKNAEADRKDVSKRRHEKTKQTKSDEDGSRRYATRAKQAKKQINRGKKKGCKTSSKQIKKTEEVGRNVGKSSTRKKKLDENTCRMCGGIYGEPPHEDWQQCPECKCWYHISCVPDDTVICFFCLN